MARLPLWKGSSTAAEPFRVGVGKHIILANMSPENAQVAADVMSNAGDTRT